MLWASRKSKGDLTKEEEKKIVENGHTKAEAKLIVASRVKGKLHDDDVLYFAHMEEGVTVRGC